MTQTLSLAIDFYINCGYTLFPLNGKHPLKGFHWPRSEFNPLATAEDFPSGNFGVKLDADDLVIDVDPRNFPPGKNSFLELQAAIGHISDNSTFIVQTGGGGSHYYFKKPGGCLVRGTLKEYPGIEFKTAGQYLVGAGSIHPDTKKAYLILCDGPVAQAPQALLDLLQKTTCGAAPGLEAYVDDTQTRNRFVCYLKTAPIAVEGASGDRVTFSVAAVGHDLGLHPDITLELMLEHYNPQCEPPWLVDDLKAKVYNAYHYASGNIGTASAIDKFGSELAPGAVVSDLRVDQYGRIQKSVYNTVVVLNIDCPGMLALNIFSEDITFLKAAPWHLPQEHVTNWTDSETARCQYYMSHERKFEPSTAMIEDAIINVAWQHPFHPIKDYLESIKWDGVSRLKDWLVKYLGVLDNTYSRSVGLKMLVAAVTRVYQPGYKFDYIPVFEGPQGIGKSRALAVLGGEWYGDIIIDVHNKDTVDIMRSLWIIEVSEMETHYRTETQAMKSFLSRSSDICRLAYGRRSKVFPRHCIFVGTINPEYDEDAGYLKDTTGNRRYWPLVCQKIDIDSLQKVRDQLWAEALSYYKDNKVTLHFEDTTIEEQAVAEQLKRMGIDPWFDQIEQWLDCEMNKNKLIFASSQIFCDCLGGRATQFTRPSQTRIALVMRKLNWQKGVFHSPELGKPVRGYRRPESELGI